MRSACREYTLWYGKVTPTKHCQKPTFFISALQKHYYLLTYLALRSSGPWQDNGQQEFVIRSCL